MYLKTTLSITLFVTCLHREFSIKNIYASQTKQKKYPERCWIFWYLPLNGFCLMVFNATFNNISVILWQSVLLVEKTTDLSQVTDKLYHIMLYTSPWSRFEHTTSVVIGTDCISSCTSIYHTITTTTAPPLNGQPSFQPPKIYSICICLSDVPIQIWLGWLTYKKN